MTPRPLQDTVDYVMNTDIIMVTGWKIPLLEYSTDFHELCGKDSEWSDPRHYITSSTSIINYWLLPTAADFRAETSLSLLLVCVHLISNCDRASIPTIIYAIYKIYRWRQLRNTHMILPTDDNPYQSTTTIEQKSSDQETQDIIDWGHTTWLNLLLLFYVVDWSTDQFFVLVYTKIQLKKKRNILKKGYHFWKMAPQLTPPLRKGGWRHIRSSMSTHPTHTWPPAAQCLLGTSARGHS